MIFTSNKILNILIFILLSNSIAIISLIIKYIMIFFKLNDMHNQLIEYAKKINKFWTIETSDNMLAEFYEKFISIQTNATIVHKVHEISVAEYNVKLKWGKNLSYIINLIEIFETTTPFLGWVTTYCYYTSIHETKATILLWPISFSMFILTFITIMKKLFNQRIEKFNIDLDTFKTIISAKWTTIQAQAASSISAKKKEQEKLKQE